MVSYRQIKTEVDPVTVVLFHATLSVAVSIPLMGKVLIITYNIIMYKSPAIFSKVQKVQLQMWS